MSNDIVIKNKKASHEYEFLETFTCGIVLQGTEIKSIRQGKASIMEAYCRFDRSELFIYHMHISEYDKGGFVNHVPTRTRKLLLNKLELKRLEKKLKDQGLTIVPTRLFISESGYAKLNIALAKGKKLFDKRESLKQADSKRDMDRAMNRR
ncbi:SsrA-binding protein SmpB [bacterium SCSIO 12643]|nr:SsrA-binding protein SmpB [bacterium SCSIO 12643]